jgi:hypothetical protein
MILRRNQAKPGRPPLTVKIVQGPDGTYWPLDNRTIDWLYKSDLQRRFTGYSERQFGRLLDKAMRDEEDEINRQKAKVADEVWNEVMDKANFEFRQMERRGQL